MRITLSDTSTGSLGPMQVLRALEEHVIEHFHCEAGRWELTVRVEDPRSLFAALGHLDSPVRYWALGHDGFGARIRQGPYERQVIAESVCAAYRPHAQVHCYRQLHGQALPAEFR